MIQEIKERILKGGAVSLDEALALLSTENTEELYAAANEIRQHFMGDTMDTCSILNARSGRCSEDCKWCAQSAFHKTKVEEYELVDMKVAELQAMENASQGVNKFSLVTSGRALSNKNLNELCGVYKKIGQQSDIQLCASMGLLKREQLEKLVEAGVKHYHCNIETAPSFFSQLCTTHSMEEKIETIKMAQELGMGVCSGGIIGMGETMEQRVEMAFTLRKLNIRSIPINILMKVEGTKIGEVAPLSDEEVLTSFALFRLINPQANIRLAGGRQLIAHIQEHVLKAGVSAALVGDYLTTIGTNIAQDKEIFKNAGFSLGTEKLQCKSSCQA
jgi:biotin synthase